MIIGIIVILFGVIFFFIGVVGGNGANNELLDKSKEYSREAFSDNSDSDKLKEILDDQHSITKDIKFWNNVVLLGQGLVFFGIFLSFFSMLFPFGRKAQNQQQYYEEYHKREPQREPPTREPPRQPPIQQPPGMRWED